MPLWLTSSEAAGAEPTYWQDVRPALRKHCTVCHSVRNVNELEVSGGLALDSFQAITKGEKVIVRPGQGDDSLLVKVVVHPKPERRMPPGGKQLPEETVALLRKWIDTGAKEGTKPDVEETTVTTGPPRTRKLEVLLSTSLTPPSGAFGKGTPAPLKLSLQAGPLAPVTTVAFSPDGKTLAVGSYGRVVLWDVAAVRPVKTISSVLGTVNAVRYSPDGKLLAVAGGQPSAKGDLRLFDAEGKLQATLSGHEDVVSGVSFSPDGKRLASASFDRTVRVWDLATRKTERTLTGHSDFVYAVAFAPDGKGVASAGKDRSVKVAEADTGKSRFTLGGTDVDVLAVAISPDGQTVVSSGEQPSLVWWNAKTGERVRAVNGHGVAVHELAFSRDGKTLVSAGADGTVRLWDGSSGVAVKTLSPGSTSYTAALSPDGKFVATGGFDGLVRLWDAATGRQLLTLLALPPRDDETDWVALTPEGYVAASAKLRSGATWKMGNQAADTDAVWKVLGKPEQVARAARGETVPAPFGK